jgi:hypothetical protein
MECTHKVHGKNDFGDDAVEQSDCGNTLVTCNETDHEFFQALKVKIEEIISTLNSQRMSVA